MCRSLEDGGRRCNHGSTYGKSVAALQAKKQYYTKQLEAGGLSREKRKTVNEKLRTTVNAMNSMRSEFNSFGVGRHFTMELTEPTKKVLNQLEQDGFKPFIVGGSVRDVLMGADNKDIDIEVYGGTPEAIATSLRKIGNVDEVGKAFGVLKITLQGEDFDVSLPRRDSKVGDGHRGFEIQVDPDLTLEEATERRDFTINALMYSAKHEYIIDKHGGLKDLEDKKLRHVSEAFDEDPLRVLRGVQMSSRFGMDLDESTVEKAKTLKTQFSDLAKERVQIEFQKLYEKGKSSDKALKLLQETEWDENFPGLKEANTDELRASVKRGQELISSGDVAPDRRAMFLSAIISSGIEDTDKRRNFLSYTTVGDDTKNMAMNLTTQTLPEVIDNKNIRSLAYGLPRGLTIRDISNLEKAKGHDEVAEHLYSEAQSAGVLDNYEPDLVTGREVIGLFPGRRPGPWVKDILDKAREAQYSNVFDNSDAGFKWLKEQNFSE